MLPDAPLHAARAASPFPIAEFVPTSRGRGSSRRRSWRCAGAVQLDAVAGGGAVSRDGVALGVRGPADRVARGGQLNDHAVLRVPERRQARAVGADQVPLDEVAGGAGAADVDAAPEVPADDVGRRGSRRGGLPPITLLVAAPVTRTPSVALPTAMFAPALVPT